MKNSDARKAIEEKGLSPFDIYQGFEFALAMAVKTEVLTMEQALDITTDAARGALITKSIETMKADGVINESELTQTAPVLN